MKIKLNGQQREVKNLIDFTECLNTTAIIAKEASYKLEPQRFWYKIKTPLVKVVDADTLETMTDLTMNTFNLSRIRLAGIQAPEENTGTKGAELLKRKIEMYSYIWIKTVQDKNHKQKKTFDRFIGFVFDPYGGLINDWVLLNVPGTVPLIPELIENGESWLST
jgi:endonuclease YncB( thermonuclease family)